MQNDHEWREAFLASFQNSTHTEKAYRKELADLYAYAEAQRVYSAVAMGASFFEKLSAGLPGLKVSKSAAERFASAVRSYFRFLVKQGIVPTNASDFLIVPQTYEKERKRPILQKEEIERLLAAPEGESFSALRDRAVLCLLYSAGLRANEMTGITAEDLDLQTGFVHVNGRRVPFDRRARKALIDYLDARKEKTKNPDGLLFFNKKGERMSRQSIWNIVQKHAKALNLADKTDARTLRRSLTYHLMQQGAEEDTVKEILGVKSAASYSRYRNAFGKRVRKAMKKI